ncbi:HD-GYP domain-containing protein [Bacillaceae bacterium]
MRLISIDFCQPGMRLARPVFNRYGHVLAGKDVELSQRMIEHLKRLGVDKVYVRDPLTDDLTVEDPLSEETQRLALETITNMFLKLRNANGVRSPFKPGELSQNFYKVVDAILGELQTKRGVVNLLSNVFVTDEYLFSHSLKVALFALNLGIKQGFNEKQLVELGMGAILHDIGKMKIPREILQKPGPLTEEEFAEIKKHTLYGFEILRAEDTISFLSAHCALQHHERLDGSGYPRGLKDNEIHPYAQVIAIADVFDALTSHRVYRKAFLPDKAMEILQKDAGRLFDPQLVESFRSGIVLYPIGMTVVLNSGETGVVVDYNKNLPHRPVVRVIQDAEGNPFPAYHEIDLSKRPDLCIDRCDAVL